VTDIGERLHIIRDQLRSGRFGQREVWEQDLNEAVAEIERLKALSQNNAHSWDAIVRERDELRAALRDCINGRRDWMEKAKAALVNKP